MPESKSSKYAKAIGTNYDYATRDWKLDFLPALTVDKFTYDAAGSAVLDGFTFIPKVTNADRQAPGNLKQFLYGDSSLHGSGYWNGFPSRVKSALEQVLGPAESYLCQELRQCAIDLQAIKHKFKDMSHEDLIQTKSVIKKGLQDTYAVVSLLDGGMAKVDEAVQYLKDVLGNPAFEGWRAAFARIQSYNKLLKERQDKLYSFYEATAGPNCWYGNGLGGPPFTRCDRIAHLLPEPREYKLQEPDSFADFKRRYQSEDRFFEAFRNYPHGYGNYVVAIEYSMDRWAQESGHGMSSPNVTEVEGMQYMLSRERQRVDRAFDSANDLRLEARGARLVGTYILQSFEDWGKGYAEVIQPPLSKFRDALLKLYGNLHSADEDEIALNWAETDQTCHAYITAVDNFMAAPASIVGWADVSEDDDNV